MPKGLRTPVTGVGERREQELHDRWNSHDKALKWLWDKGIALASEPEFDCPKVEAKMLTTGSPAVYAEMFTKLLAWHEYVGEQFALVKAMKGDAEDEMGVLEAETRESLRKTTGKKPSNQAMEDTILTNERHIELKVIARDATTLKDFLSVKLDNIERRLRAVSRQIELAKIDAEGHKREGNLGRPRRTRVPVRPS